MTLYLLVTCGHWPMRPNRQLGLYADIHLKDMLIHDQSKVRKSRKTKQKYTIELNVAKTKSNLY